MSNQRLPTMARINCKPLNLTAQVGTYHSRPAVEDIDGVAILDLVPPQRLLFLHDVLQAADDKLCGDADPSGPTNQDRTI
jgi:hypothetical protein